MKKVLVVLSGGQDSTTCLIHYKNIYKNISCITFDYNQLHESEINCARVITKKMGIKNHIVLNIKYLKDIFVSGLIKDNIHIKGYHPLNSALPSTFVPGRNILFLTLSSIYAYTHQIDLIVLGVNEIDFSGYPDCQDEFIKIMNNAIQIGMNYKIDFQTPLINLNKAEIWALSDYWNSTNLILNNTVTCYNGIKGTGCTECQACIFRKNGFDEWQSNRAYYIKKIIKKMKLF